MLKYYESLISKIFDTKIKSHIEEVERYLNDGGLKPHIFLRTMVISHLKNESTKRKLEILNSSDNDLKTIILLVYLKLFYFEDDIK